MISSPKKHGFSAQTSNKNPVKIVFLNIFMLKKGCGRLGVADTELYMNHRLKNIYNRFLIQKFIVWEPKHFIKSNNLDFHFSQNGCGKLGVADTVLNMYLKLKNLISAIDFLTKNTRFWSRTLHMIF